MKYIRIFEDISLYKEIEFVCHNSQSNSSTTYENLISLYNDLSILKSKTANEIYPYMQDFSDDGYKQISLAVVILNRDKNISYENMIMDLAKKNNVEFDLYSYLTNRQ